ncbi:S-layer homology domain-containing protein [Viridibacillus sp. NPDC096237]|uniref:S-layer homology domain-containing protein n=1 Tax=Viridibacillus sp. NPDC096237 TaxID=3390721 RepID=UPI003D0279F4
MGKFNLKLVKPVASLAIGAAVLTGSFAVSGAADTAFAKAATVKVSKGKLVSAKSGKAVKGYKSYKGILYKNGKKFTGLYKNTYYKTGKKGTGLYKNVYYKAGKKGSGWVGSGSSKKWYQDGKLLTGLGKNSGKLFIKGKYANGIVTYKGVQKLYKDGVVVKTVVDAAKAINNTTVEVTFAEAQKASDISAGRFKIEGLEVTNAAVKQTDDKVIVLTTAAQTGGKTYTVALDGVKSRTFKGVSNVLPTAITNQTPSLQGIIGKEVTVKTQVEVPAGQSKEGIAVTFNITNSADTSVGNFGKKITAEAFTDANGVASYSYTQYVAGTDDTVEAYPTGNASVKTTAAKVYWGNVARLTLSEVTEGNSLANGAKKVYKIVSAENANGYINIAYKENVNVAPDKLVRTVDVTDANIRNNGAKYPSQVTTGGVQYVKVKLDSKGEATFTLTGTSGTVTPIAFADGKYKDNNVTSNEDTWSGDNKLGATELQAAAAPVTFALNHTQSIDVVAADSANAAADSSLTSNPNGTGKGGRTYTATITGKDGKLAPAGTTAYVTFVKGNYSQDKKVNISTVKGENVTTANENTTFAIKVTGDKGQATFKVTGERDGYATPTVYIENGDKAGLDPADLQKVAETTYFVNATVSKATLKVDDTDKKVAANKPAVFTFQSVDQNGFPYALSYNGLTGRFDVTFEVAARYADVEVNGTTVPQGSTKSITIKAEADGSAKITVKSKGDLSADVTVNASASQVSIGNVSESIQFIKGLDEGAYVSSEVLAKINAATNKDGIEDALEEVDNYRTLSVDEQAYVLNTIFAERNTNKTVSSIFVSTTINTAKTEFAAVITKINADKAEAADYTKAGIDLKGQEVADVNAAVKAAKGAGADLTKAQIQAEINKLAGAASETAAIKTINAGKAEAADYTKAGVDLKGQTVAAVNVAVVAAKGTGADLTKAQIQAEVDKLVEAAAIVTINKGTAVAADYSKAGVDLKGQTVAAVNAAVEAAKKATGKDLTKTDIQTEVDKLASVASLKKINDGSATINDYNAAGVTGVDIYNFDKVKAAVALKKSLNNGKDLTVAEVQDVVTNLPK